MFALPCKFRLAQLSRRFRMPNGTAFVLAASASATGFAVVLGQPISPFPFHRRPFEVSMRLDALDDVQLFSLTLWKNEAGFCAGVQKQAGDLVRYETRKTASAAIVAAIKLCVPIVPPPPF